MPTRKALTAMKSATGLGKAEDHDPGYPGAEQRFVVA
jgi:hypothetical protein